MAITKTNTHTSISGNAEWTRTNNSKTETATFTYLWDGENKQANYYSNGRVMIDGKQVATWGFDAEGKKTIHTKHDLSEIGEIIDTAVSELEASFS